MPSISTSRVVRCAALTASLALAACGAPKPTGPIATPIYNEKDGTLEQLVTDANGDGKVDTRAFMKGLQLQRIEIDRNGDDAPDRWEYYDQAPPGVSVPNSPDGRAMITRAEEANGTGQAITRRELYERGVIARVEEDTNVDGRLDKWEIYEAGELAHVDLDLGGKGFADRRLVYGDGGNVIRIEADPEGDGTFVLVPMPKPEDKPKGK